MAPDYKLFSFEEEVKKNVLITTGSVQLICSFPFAHAVRFLLTRLI